MFDKAYLSALFPLGSQFWWLYAVVFLMAFPWAYWSLANGSIGRDMFIEKRMADKTKLILVICTLICALPFIVLLAPLVPAGFYQRIQESDLENVGKFWQFLVFAAWISFSASSKAVWHLHSCLVYDPEIPEPPIGMIRKCYEIVEGLLVEAAKKDEKPETN